MNKAWDNIFNQIKTAAGTALLLGLSLAFVVAISPVAYAGPNDFCPASGESPDITATAQCEKESCDSKPGCLDPAPVKPANRFSSTPGQRKQSYGPDGKPVGSTGHKGNDIAAPMNAVIYAGADGKIVAMGHQMNAEKNTGWGNYVKIEHKDGVTTTLYAHMNCFAERIQSDGSRVRITSGSEVKKGQVIGFVGMTGGTSGPHLHYEIIKGGVAYNATLPENQSSGMLCEIPQKFVSAAVPTDGMNPSGGGGASGGNCGGGGSSGGSNTNCAKMYPEDDLGDLHHKYESSGNPCSFNKCNAGDAGGCSYGSSQLSCTRGSMKEYLTSLEKSNPQVWAALGGGSVAAMNARACNAPATDFSSKWSALCTSDLGTQLNSSQGKYMESQYLTPALNSAKKNYGIDFSQHSPELQMTLYSTVVQHGAGGLNSILKNISKYAGDLNQMKDEDLLSAIYKERGDPKRFASSSTAVQESVKVRFANENAEVQESLKIRKAWEEEQKKTPHKTYEQVVQEITGKEPCAEGKSGSFACTGTMGGGATSTDTPGERPDKDCSPSQYSETMKTCLFCPLFKVIFDTASRMAKLTFNKLAMPVMSVVLVAWAIWVAMTVLKFVSSMATKDAPTLIKELLGKSIVVLVVVLFLQSDSSTFFQMALEPIFNTGFKLAQLALADGACTKEFDVLKDGGLPPSMGNSILCTIQAVQDKLVDTMSLGSASMCVGWYVKSKLAIFGSLAYVLSGLLIWLGCLVMLIIFPFLMLDAIFQLTVACALLPAAIGCYPFKPTNGYVKKIWNSFLNAMFNFIFLSIVILILTTAIDVTLTQSIDNTMGGADMNDVYMEVIVNALAWSGVALIKIVFVLLLGWVVLDEISGFASDFAGGISTGGIGRQVGGLAASGGQKLGGKAWKSAKKVGGAVGENVKEAAGDWNRERKMNNITRNGTAENVTDESGKVVGQKFVSKNKSWFRGRDKTNEVTVKGAMKDGVFVADNNSKMLVTSKDYGNGKVVTTKSDGFLKQTETKVNGKVTGGNISIESAGLKAIRNRDGTMNTTALDAALRGSAFDENIVRAAAMQEYAKKSFPDVSNGFNSVSGVGEFNGSLDKADISFTTDEKGRQVLQVSEKGEDGAGKVMRMTMSENGRPLIEVENIQANGRFLSRSTDGMFNRLSDGTIDLKTGEKSGLRSEYSVSQYYASKTTHAVDDNGNLSGVFAGDTKTAFSDEELKSMKSQFINDRRRGQPNTIGGIL